MKKLRILLILLLSVIINLGLFAQSIDSISNDFYSFSNKMDAYYDNLKLAIPDTMKIPGLKSYERQKNFWSTRVFSNDIMKGSYSKYIEQLTYYSNNPSLLPQLNTSNTWEFVGPVNLQQLIIKV
ncbi:MAG: hypothetical protein COW63_02835 [Bacteroidetes bacterium CG18_big_fil_WC_8_21_14_2_50_41_14]|nr:MAG: hypothetical protein COW63_02835 [Bacteroidetes bacterium CG18_big_fil_WC_8_21_14_2_50_41_14]PIY31318.1 MAG: hypothetical protein COZ08_09035 [Bacteroidetes bacterium CG_4_10_14_3_um_filter_42_6]PJB54884.1 MAG: hypothetical protein CO098_19325 [Bacteroidetes bacterium CG_4_9_14_3_um_filter_41_19]